MGTVSCSITCNHPFLLPWTSTPSPILKNSIARLNKSGSTSSPITFPSLPSSPFPSPRCCCCDKPWSWPWTLSVSVSISMAVSTEEDDWLGEAGVSRASRMRRQDLSVSRIVWYCREEGPKVSRVLERLVVIYKRILIFFWIGLGWSRQNKNPLYETQPNPIQKKIKIRL